MHKAPLNVHRIKHLDAFHMDIRPFYVHISEIYKTNKDSSSSLTLILHFAQHITFTEFCSKSPLLKIPLYAPFASIGGNKGDMSLHDEYHTGNSVSV